MISISGAGFLSNFYKENFHLISFTGIDGSKREIILDSDSPYFGMISVEEKVPLSKDALDAYVDCIRGDNLEIFNLQMARELSDFSKKLNRFDLIESLTLPLITFFAKRGNEIHFDESCIIESPLFFEVFFIERLGTQCFCDGMIFTSNSDFNKIFCEKDTHRILDYFTRTGLMKNLHIKKAKTYQEHESEEQYYQKVFQAHSDLKNTLDYASVLIEFGQFLLNEGYVEDAKLKLVKSLQIYQNVCEKAPMEDEAFRGASKVLLLQSFIMKDQQKDLLNRAEYYASIPASRKQNPENYYSLSNVLIEQAECLQSENALSEEAFLKFQTVVGYSLYVQKSKPKFADNIDNLARAYKGQAKYVELVIDEESAQPLYMNAEENFQSLLPVTFYGSNSFIPVRRDLAEVYLKRADFLEKQNPENALARYRKIAELGSLVFGSDTTDHAILPTWTKALIKTGNVLVPNVIAFQAKRIEALENQNADQKMIVALKKIYSECLLIQKTTKESLVLFKKPLVASVKRRAHKRVLEVSSAPQQPRLKRQKTSENWSPKT